jgi:hypothetical protein
MSIRMRRIAMKLDHLGFMDGHVVYAWNTGGWRSKPILSSVLPSVLAVQTSYAQQ